MGLRTETGVPEERKTFLSGLNDAIAGLTDPREIEDVVTGRLAAHMRAWRSYVWMIDKTDPAVALASERVLAVADIDLSPLPVEERRDARRKAVRAFISAPFLAHGRFVGALTVAEPHARAWTSGEVELVQEVAQCAWAALRFADAERPAP